MLKAKVNKLGRRITVGEDKAYDTADHVTNLRAINVAPHVAQNDSITSSADATAYLSRVSSPGA